MGKRVGVLGQSTGRSALLKHRYPRVSHQQSIGRWQAHRRSRGGRRVANGGSTRNIRLAFHLVIDNVCNTRAGSSYVKCPDGIRTIGRKAGTQTVGRTGGHVSSSTCRWVGMSMECSVDAAPSSQRKEERAPPAMPAPKPGSSKRTHTCRRQSPEGRHQLEWRSAHQRPRSVKEGWAQSSSFLMALFVQVSPAQQSLGSSSDRRRLPHSPPGPVHLRTGRQQHTILLCGRTCT